MKPEPKLSSAGAAAPNAPGYEPNQRLAELIATIDGIARQAHVLAYDAAVEAARAGEEGRGFAVASAETADRLRTQARALMHLVAVFRASTQGLALSPRPGPSDAGYDPIVAWTTD